MKKIVLAILSDEEIDAFYDAKCFYETLLSLMTNQFITEEEKEGLKKQVEEAQNTYVAFTEIFTKKYSLPRLTGVSLQVSQDTNELYVLLP